VVVYFLFSVLSLMFVVMLYHQGTMIHELGHNLGCTHDFSASTAGTAFKSYSHGMSVVFTRINREYPTYLVLISVNVR
jgi:hypothetical protein